MTNTHKQTSHTWMQHKTWRHSTQIKSNQTTKPYNTYLLRTKQNKKGPGTWETDEKKTTKTNTQTK